MDERHSPVPGICCRLSILLTFDCRVFMPNLVPPKIPDGERLDFDVSSALSVNPHEVIPLDRSSALCSAALQLLDGFTCESVAITAVSIRCRTSIASAWRRT